MTPFMLLRAFGVQSDDRGNLILEFEEHQKRELVVAESRAGELFVLANNVFAGAVNVGLLDIQLRKQKKGGSVLRVKAGSAVGFATSAPPHCPRVFVRVAPKVGTHRMIELAALAGMLPPWQPGGAYVASTLEAALLEWTLWAYVESLKRLLAKGGLRRSHEHVKADLVNRLKGRLLVGPWLRNVSRAAPHILPAEFPSLEVDNEPNQFLKWALRTAVGVAKELGNAGLAEACIRLERSFAGVGVKRFTSGAAAVRVLSPSMRHYKEAIQGARYVIESARLGSKAGDVESMSLVLDMNRVYERAFFNGLRAIAQEANRHEEWPIQLRSPNDSGGGTGLQRTVHMIPDVWIESTDRRLPIVVDTKWKHVLSRVAPADAVLGDEETRTVQVNSADIYQAMAYGVEVLHQRHVAGKAVVGCVAALVYPTLRQIPDLGCEFRIGEPSLSLAMLGWNVSDPPIEGLNAIWTSLKAIAERSDPAQLEVKNAH